MGCGKVLLGLGVTCLCVSGSTCWPTLQHLEVIVDNQDAGFAIVSGTWGTADTSDGNGCYGPDFRYHLADRSSVGVASFTPVIPQTGSYAVYIYWSADPNRTTSQPVIVNHADGVANYTVNLQQHGNQWYLLGSHTFNAGVGAAILFTTDTDAGYCNADAVRLVSNF